MRASELIELLQEMIDKHGDKECFYNGTGYPSEINVRDVRLSKDEDEFCIC